MTDVRQLAPFRKPKLPTRCPQVPDGRAVGLLSAQLIEQQLHPHQSVYGGLWQPVSMQMPATRELRSETRCKAGVSAFVWPCDQGSAECRRTLSCEVAGAIAVAVVKPFLSLLMAVSSQNGGDLQFDQLLQAMAG
jgi:hypothetical protein